jgi:hypothetical protein
MKMSEDTTYNYDHLVKKCELHDEQRAILFGFYERLFVCCGDLDEYYEKQFNEVKNNSSRVLQDCITQLSDSIKGELWRELERQGLDIIYEREHLDIKRNEQGEIIS